MLESTVEFSVPFKIILLLLLAAGLAFGQVPPGPPYVVERHPNPIVTFVQNGDFVAATYEDARVRAGFDLLGLSATDGKLDRITMTTTKVEEIRILGRDSEVLFYPVICQRFVLTDGEVLELYSFRNPRSDASAERLNEHAFMRQNPPAEQRFGGGPPPGESVVRGTTALIFDDQNGRSIFWQESDQSHVATSSVPFERLFRLVENLL